MVDHFPSSRLDSVTGDELGKFKESWKVKPSTAIKKLERLRSFFKSCVDRDWIAKNPAKALKSPKETVIEKKPYDQWELEKIAWAIPLFSSKGIYGDENVERIRAFVAVLRYTGLRIRDAVQLKYSAVGEFITIRTHKNGKPVQLPIHPEIASSLAKMPPLRVLLLVGVRKPQVVRW